MAATSGFAAREEPESCGPGRPHGSLVARRIGDLTEQLRGGLGKLRNVHLVSPDHPDLRSAIVCFTVDGVEPVRAVESLAARGVHLSVTPYRDVYLRAGCPLWVDEHGVDRALEAIGRLA